MSNKFKYTSDEKMLQLIDILKAYGSIRFDSDFCDTIHLRKQNLYNIRNDKTHFTSRHIELAVKGFKVNANWIYGISDLIFTGNIKGNVTLKTNKTQTKPIY
ncbi:hypothetical protein [Gaetbulibacter sp. PBL-D1]|uniref:hypothetical protein n=1 Tax=Gaetbulibacter sp. PBL-D1 TaxID=3422594 RepID=UPI003D2F3F8D